MFPRRVRIGKHVMDARIFPNYTDGWGKFSYVAVDDGKYRTFCNVIKEDHIRKVFLLTDDIATSECSHHPNIPVY